MTKHILSLVVAGLVLSGCAITPDIDAPKLNIPDRYFDSNATQEQISLTWWQYFNDDILNELVDKAISNNSDIQIAMSRVELSRSMLGIESSNLYPSLDLQGGASRSKSMSSGYNIGNIFSLSAILNYELDLWGRVRGQKESARLKLLAQESSKDTVKISIVSSVVQSYFVLIGLENQKAILVDMVNSLENTLSLRKSQYKNGAITQLPVLQTEALLKNNQAQLTNIQEAILLQQSSLRELVGDDPKSIFEANKIVFDARLPKSIEIPSGIPSSLLENRPDVQSALFNMKALNIDTQVAKTAYFPTISLSAAFGFANSELSDLFKSESQVWNVGGNILTPLFNAGKISSQVDVAKANEKIAFDTYIQTLRIAFKEVYDALTKREYAVESFILNKSSNESLQKAYYLAQKQFDVGVINSFELLDAQRSYLNSSLAVVQSRVDELLATVEIFKSLGGGWSKKDLDSQ